MVRAFTTGTWRNAGMILLKWDCLISNPLSTSQTETNLMYLYLSVSHRSTSMNFNTIFLKSFRVLLLPVALVYGFIVYIRNRLFDKNYLKSADFNFPLICVGNIAVGGTGKSPMVEYLVRLLKPQFKVG